MFDPRQQITNRVLQAEVSDCCEALALLLVPFVHEQLNHLMVSWNTAEDSISFEEARKGVPGRVITVTGDCYQ